MTIYIIGGMLLLAAIFYFQKQKASGEVFSRFGLRESSYRMLSTDLGKSEGRIKLSRHGINGIADAVFEAVTGYEIVVGEFKSRKYRQKVKLYELYQITLYIGHLRSLYPKHHVRGVLAYADGKVSVTFDPALYDALIGLRPEYWESVKQRKVVNSTPLHKRIKVNALNRGLRLAAEL